MAAELQRKDSQTTILAIHPGEVATSVLNSNGSWANILTLLRDMASNVSPGWEIEGILSVSESVSAMLKVIPTKTIKDTGTFWTWEGKVSYTSHQPNDKAQSVMYHAGISLVGIQQKPRIQGESVRRMRKSRSMSLQIEWWKQ